MSGFPTTADEFPTHDDLEDVYEQQFEDELELIRESEIHSEGNIIRNEANSARRTLDFSSPAMKAKTQTVSRGDVQDLEMPEINESPKGREKRSRSDDLHAAELELDWDALLPERKRHKPDCPPPDEDEVLIQRILEARRIRSAVTRVGVTTHTDGVHYEVSKNLSYDIPRWAFTGVTRGDGTRLYVRLEAEEAAAGGTQLAVAGREHLREVYAETWQEARNILKESREVSSGAEETPLVALDAPLETALPWAERHRPRSYSELLSAEPDNRAALHWLKLWDKVVFNREVKTREPLKANSFNKRTGGWEARRTAGGQEVEESELDEAGRPRRRILLLCGPPGAGKTTLAHLLATHAGYRPLELNASDDRSVEVFRTTLRNATEMQATLHADTRPNCLILDEIDGAPLPTVEFLAKFVTGTAGSEKGSKKGRPHALRRPIVCICNDMWVPALRPIRQLARVVHVTGVTSARLAGRLAEVCAKEGVKADPPALLALAERSAGDVRAALTNLQFLTRLKQVRLCDVARLAAEPGKGDAGAGVVPVLRQVLCDRNIDTKTLLHSISNLGDYDRLAEGVLENYASCSGSVEHAASAVRALTALDVTHTYMMSTQNYALYPFMPLAFLRCRRLSNKHSFFIKFPTQAQEKRSERTRTASVIEAVRVGAAATLRPHATTLALVLDLLPLLPHVLAPHLRSHNVQLYSEREKDAVSCVASVMCDYGLALEQTRVADGTYAYTLQPDILRVAVYSGGGTARRLTYAVQQTIAREVQLEMMRRAEIKSTGPNLTIRKEPATSRAPCTVPAASSAASATLPNHLQRLQPKKIETTSVAMHKDFFGRTRTATAAEASAAGNAVAGSAVARSSLYYHYREGFNNAVRRSVKLRDII